MMATLKEVFEKFVPKIATPEQIEDFKAATADGTVPNGENIIAVSFLVALTNSGPEATDLAAKALVANGCGDASIWYFPKQTIGMLGKFTPGQIFPILSNRLFIWNTQKEELPKVLEIVAQQCNPEQQFKLLTQSHEKGRKEPNTISLNRIIDTGGTIAAKTVTEIIQDWPPKLQADFLSIPGQLYIAGYGSRCRNLVSTAHLLAGNGQETELKAIIDTLEPDVQTTILNVETYDQNAHTITNKTALHYGFVSSMRRWMGLDPK